jgi:hypothetical protein
MPDGEEDGFALYVPWKTTVVGFVVRSAVGIAVRRIGVEGATAGAFKVGWLSTGLPVGGDTGAATGAATGLPVGDDTGFSVGGDTGLPVGGDTGFSVGGDTGLPVGGDTGFSVGGDTGLPVGGLIIWTGGVNGLPVGAGAGFAGAGFGRFPMFNMKSLKRLKSMDPRPDAGSHPGAAEKPCLQHTLSAVQLFLPTVISFMN